METEKAVFLDKDGTLIKDIPYNVDPKFIFLTDQSVQGLKNLLQAGFKLIVISNQGGIAKGYFKEEDLEKCFLQITDLMCQHGIKISAYYYCPHHPEGIVKEFSFNCDCRKPLPGLLKKAAVDFHIDLARSWMIGDILDDIEAGTLAGCKTILIDNGNETEWLSTDNRIPDHTASSINHAAGYILN